MNPRPLTKAESDELKALYERPFSNLARFQELRDQCWLYGDSTVQPRAFEGLMPRYAGYRQPLDLGGATIGMVEQPDGSIRIVP